MALKPSFEGKDIEQLTYHLFRASDNKQNSLLRPTLDNLRRLNVIDSIHPEKKKRQLDRRRELVEQCQLFINQNTTKC